MSSDAFEAIEVDKGSERSVIQFPGASIMDQVEVTGERDGGLIDCMVPSRLIDHEEVPVKEEWALSLAEQMQEIANQDGGTGQLMPIILGQIEGENRLKIVDGFHREAALRANGAEEVFATVKPMDWDTLYDVRIFTAKDHAHVRFSRVVQWIQEVWQHFDLSDRITVEQAVLLYRFDTSGAKLGLAPEEAAQAKEWVQRKEQQWGMAAMTMHSHLKIAEHVDPQLVHSTREKQNSRELVAPTQVILKIFSQVLPDRYDFQNLVMDVAKIHNMRGPQVRAVCEAIKESETLEDARLIVESTDWSTSQPSFGKTTQWSIRREYDPTRRGGAVFGGVASELQLIEQVLDELTDQGNRPTPQLIEKSQRRSAYSFQHTEELGYARCKNV